jgi:hypothetical protein
MTLENELDHTLVDDAEDEDDDVSVASATSSSDGAPGNSKKKKKRVRFVSYRFEWAVLIFNYSTIPQKKKKVDSTKPANDASQETNAPSTSGAKAKNDKNAEKRYIVVYMQCGQIHELSVCDLQMERRLGSSSERRRLMD